ncbi:prolipoprotein diacylglyceryl transferase [Diplocloster hominis]|uniref:prolipoprotein diacylglyceryl transferase n=1 Tax=Diplocloster hominis TaxID=3079010 RepID=UPI0031BAC034
MDTSILFPNLGLQLEHVGKSIRVFGLDIAYYGIVIGIGMVVGILLACREAKRTGQNTNDYIDLAIYAIIFSIVGARLYFVAFSWDQYKEDLMLIFNLRAGGLAIYGGVIAAVITVYVFARKRKLNFWQMVDTGCIGLIAGQIIGRWGNFFNREAFGGYTDNLLAMQLPVTAVRAGDISADIAAHIQVIHGVEYIQVHPTFLYESLWNLCIFLVLLWYRKQKKFQGELFLIYLFGYGLGRVWIEGLRTDQLLLPFAGIPASQLLSAILVILSAVTIVVRHRRLNKGGM